MEYKGFDQYVVIHFEELFIRFEQICDVKF